MDAYILGKVDGDLPTQVLEVGTADNGVRVIARLDGADYDVYVALVAPNEADIETLIHELEAVGVTAISRLTRSIERPIHSTGPVVGFPNGGPSYADPLTYVIFELFDLSNMQTAVEIGEALNDASDRLGGLSKMGAAMDAHDRLLVELTSDNPELLTDAADNLRERFGGIESGAHWVRGGLQMRSGGTSSS